MRFWLAVFACLCLSFTSANNGLDEGPGIVLAEGSTAPELTRFYGGADMLPSYGLKFGLGNIGEQFATAIGNPYARYKVIEYVPFHNPSNNEIERLREMIAVTDTKILATAVTERGVLMEERALQQSKIEELFKEAFSMRENILIEAQVGGKVEAIEPLAVGRAGNVVYLSLARVRKDATLSVYLLAKQRGTEANAQPVKIPFFGKTESGLQAIYIQAPEGGYSKWDLNAQINEVPEAELLDGTTKKASQLTFKAATDLKFAVFQKFVAEGLVSSAFQDKQTHIKIDFNGEIGRFADQLTFPIVHVGLYGNQAFTNSSFVAGASITQFLKWGSVGRRYDSEGSEDNNAPGGITKLTIGMDYAKQLRKDDRFEVDSILRDGYWAYAVLDLGPRYDKRGKTAVICNAAVYYIPETTHAFGSGADRSWTYYFEFGLLFPILEGNGGGIDDTWLKVTLVDGANVANNFARSSSLKLTFSKTFSFD